MSTLDAGLRQHDADLILYRAGSIGTEYLLDSRVTRIHTLQLRWTISELQIALDPEAFDPFLHFVRR